MQSLNKWLVSICFSVFVILAQVIVTQYMMISHLRSQLEFNQTAHRLASDQIADMMYELDRVRSTRDTNNLQQFVAGAVTMIDRRDDFTAMWHDGYNRGTAVQQYAAELDAQKTSAYTDEKQ
jgi:hypothetical protein